MRGTRPTQIIDYYHICRLSLLPTDTSEDIEVNDDAMEAEITNEPTSKRPKLLMTSLMDKHVNNKKCSLDEVDQYIKLQLDINHCHSNLLDFWKQPQYHRIFPKLARLANQCFSIPCSSAGVERQFSDAGRVIKQRPANLDPSTLTNIIFL